MAVREARGLPAASPPPLPPPTREGKTVRAPPEKRKIAARAAHVPSIRKTQAAQLPPNPEKVDLTVILLASGESPHFTQEIFGGKRFDNVAVRALLLGPVTVARSRFRGHQNHRDIHVGLGGLQGPANLKAIALRHHDIE